MATTRGAASRQVHRARGDGSGGYRRITLPPTERRAATQAARRSASGLAQRATQVVLSLAGLGLLARGVGAVAAQLRGVTGQAHAALQAGGAPLGPAASGSSGAGALWLSLAALGCFVAVGLLARAPSPPDLA